MHELNQCTNSAASSDFAMHLTSCLTQRANQYNEAARVASPAEASETGGGEGGGGGGGGGQFYSKDATSSWQHPPQIIGDAHGGGRGGKGVGWERRGEAGGGGGKEAHGVAVAGACVTYSSLSASLPSTSVAVCSDGADAGRL